MVASFVVPQVQKGWLREVGRRYRRNLKVFIVLTLAVIGLKTSEGWGLGSVPQHHGSYSIASVTADTETMTTPWQRDDLKARQKDQWPPDSDAWSTSQ